MAVCLVKESSQNVRCSVQTELDSEINLAEHASKRCAKRLVTGYGVQKFNAVQGIFPYLYNYM